MAAAVRPRTVAFVIAIVMAIGSLVMWIGIPASCLWVASQVGDGSSTFSYLFALFLCPISMVLFAGLLKRLEVLHYRVSGSMTSGSATRAAWLKSVRGEREEARGPSLLDRFMVASAVLAVTVYLIWFFGFARTSLENVPVG
jgi:hypothetical protein